jgi:hypothetical protein
MRWLGCWPSHPSCPTSGGISAATARGSYGILGIGLGPGAYGVGNPLGAFGSPYSGGWKVELSGSTGTLLLGAAVPGRPDASFQLPGDGTDLYGDRAWECTKARRARAETNAKDLSVVASTTKTGFETQLALRGNYNAFEVQALNAKGQVIGTSKSFGAQ